MNGICNPMNDLPMMPQKIPDGVDFCLVTHIHPDHFTEDYLPKGIKIVVQNEEDEQTIRTMRFSMSLRWKEMSSVSALLLSRKCLRFTEITQ